MHLYFCITNYGKQFKQFLLWIFIALNISAELNYGLSDVLVYHTQDFNKSLADNLVGWFNVFLGVINAGAPGQKILEVFKTGNYTLIPQITVLFQCACSTLWGIYGLTQGNLKIILPNLIGVALTAIQLFAYFSFYIKNKGKFDKKDDDINKIEEEKSDNLITPGKDNEN